MRQVEEPSASVPAIAIRSLTCPAGERLILNDVSLEVMTGERIALVGPSGAGKSTLLLHIPGLLPVKLPSAADQSAIAVHGTPLTASSAASIRRQVGLLFQSPDDQLFCPTVQEDIAFGPLNLGLPRDEVQRRIEHALNCVGLNGYAPRFVQQLSVGEQKRVCLAGVLACQPKVLLLDEPSSSLDPRSRRSLMNILRELPGTQVIATHDLDLAVELCSRVVVLDNGRIQAAGPMSSLLSNAALMEEHGLEVPSLLR